MTIFFVLSLVIDVQFFQASPVSPSTKRQSAPSTTVPPVGTSLPGLVQKDHSLVAGDLAGYEKSGAMIVGYVDGKFTEARALCEKAGLKVVDQSRGSSYVICTWEKAKLGPALDTLARHSVVIDYVQPNYKIIVDFSNPGIVPGGFSMLEIAPLPHRPIAATAPSPHEVSNPGMPN